METLQEGPRKTDVDELGLDQSGRSHRLLVAVDVCKLMRLAVGLEIKCPGKVGYFGIDFEY
jgi:hypothetical protein